MARSSPNSGQVENNLLSIVNQGYFSDYFLAYRLDAGLADLYKRWDALERNGDPTSRTQIRGLGRSFDAFRVDAALTSPDALGDNARLDLKMLPAEGVAAERSLNDAILTALGWEPDRSEAVILTSGDKVIFVPVALRCNTSSGLLLVAIETVFATDPTTVVAGKVAPAGTLLEPDRLSARSPRAAPVHRGGPAHLHCRRPAELRLVCSGGSITLLDRIAGERAST